jgi:two-component sensor histidine kinase
MSVNTIKLTHKNNLWLQVALHLLVWGILFAFPLIFTSGESPRSTIIYIKNWLPLFFSAIIFYINYFYLIDRFLFRNQVLPFILLNILIILILMPCMELVLEQLPGKHHFRRFQQWRTPFLFRAGLSLMLTAGVSVAIRSTQRWIRAEAEKKNKENENLKSELNSLRYQLQPHFFFNSLNNIYALVDLAPEKAKQSIHGLSKLMRYLLYESNVDKVELADEIAFLKSYINLMQLRVNTNVHIEYVFPNPIPSKKIAPLMFIPLAENAFKHGISASQPSFINLRMEANNNQVSFQIINSNYPKSSTDKAGSGIGLENLKKRLDLIYPANYTFEQIVSDQVFETKLIISL